MQELFATLRTAADAAVPDRDEITRLLKQITAVSPDAGGRARAMADGLLMARGLPPLADPAPAAGPPPATGLMSQNGLLAMLGVGGAGFGLANLPFKNLPKPALPEVTNQWVLLAIVAVVGAIVGLGHVFYRNNWTLITPVVSRAAGRFQVLTFGFLRNVAVAAGVAALTTWLAFPAPEAVAPKTVDGGVEAASLLTWNVLASAVAAGVVGSRMASGEVEVKNLWKALSKTADAPAEAGLGARVREARTPFEAVTIATGTAPPGFSPAKGVVPLADETETKLVALFDRPALKTAVEKFGKPVGPDGAGLTLAALEECQLLQARLRSLLDSYDIPTVAAMTAEQFAQDVQNRGIDTAALRPTLDKLHAAATRAMELLKTLPPAWTLTAARI